MKKAMIVFALFVLSAFLMFGCTNQEQTNCVYDEETCAEFITDCPECAVCQECEVSNFESGYFIKWDKIEECSESDFSNTKKITFDRNYDGRLQLDVTITLNCGNEELVGIYTVYNDTIDIFLYKKEIGNMITDCNCGHKYFLKFDYLDKELIENGEIQIEYTLKNYNIYYENELIESGEI
ncbi:hypothetical protein KO317_03880 [Candidatus Micrarchaeota archaeon]|nr:hypothetical protein [Candidatus Micrarchaeota archaeon]